MNQLVDGFGRVHNNLRISVTDRCNIRCVYAAGPFGDDGHRIHPTGGGLERRESLREPGTWHFCDFRDPGPRGFWAGSHRP